EAPLLERVEDSRELASVEPERIGDRRLARAGLLAQHREHAVLVHREAGLLELVDRPGLDAVAEPGQEEHGAGDQLLRKRRGPVLELSHRDAHGNKRSASY